MKRETKSLQAFQSYPDDDGKYAKMPGLMESGNECVVALKKYQDALANNFVKIFVLNILGVN